MCWSCLPSDLRERITSQLAASAMTYSTMREYVLAQSARRASEPERRKTQETATPMELDMAEYGDAWEEEDAEHPESLSESGDRDGVQDGTATAGRGGRED